MPTLRSRWDLWAFYIAFGAFGIGSAINESPTMVAAPRIVAVPLYVFFVLSAVLLIGASLTNRVGLYIAGSVFGVIALVGVGVVGLFTVASPGIAITLALAAVLVMRLRRILRNRGALRAVHEED